MIRLTATRLIAPFVSALLISQAASADDEPPVVIAYGELALEPLARRVQAELRSAGREDVYLERRDPLGTCTSRPAGGESPGQVGVVLKPDEDGNMLAEICASPRLNQVTMITARGHLDSGGDFAIVVTEALHGLLSAPKEYPAETNEIDAPPQEGHELSEAQGPTDSSSVALFVEPRIVLDVPTGGMWVGVVPGFRFPLGRRLSLGTEMFVGFHPVAYSDAEMELKSHLMWARWGLSGSESYGTVALGWTVSAGAFSNRATATAALPRQGGTDGTFGAVLHAGASAEFPARGRLFLRTSVGVSTLVPRLNYQMSERATPEVGELLLEGAFGLGLRFGR